MKKRVLEKNLLLYFLNDKTDSEMREKVYSILASSLDWDYLITITTSHGACPLFYDYLRRINALSLIPPNILLVLKKSYYQNAHVNTLKYQQLAKILSIIQEKGFQVMLVKGVILAQMVYKNIALRPMGDIDMIPVNKKDEEKINVLVSKVNHSLTLEINYFHSDFIPKDWPEKKSVRFLERIWEKASPVKIAGIKVWMPCPEHFFLILMLNLSRKCNYYMRYLIDLTFFLRLYGKDLNWDLIMDIMYTFQLERRCWFIFDFFHSHLSLNDKNFSLIRKPRLSAEKKILWNMCKSQFLLADIPPSILNIIQKGTLQIPPFFPPKEVIAKIYHQSQNSHYIYFYYLIRLYDKLRQFSGFTLDVCRFLLRNQQKNIQNGYR